MDQIEQLENKILTLENAKILTSMDKMLIKNWQRSIEILKQQQKQEQNVQDKLRIIHKEG
jgi:regulator of replication initiation timing